MPRRRFAMARAAPRARRAKWAWGGCRRSSCGGGSCACPAVPGEQIEKLAPRLRAVGEVVRLGPLAVGEPLARDAIAPGVLSDLRGADPVHLRRVEAEHLRADRRSDLRIAVLRAQLGRDLEGAERLDLILGRPVPDRVGAPEHVVLTAVPEELAEPVRGLLRVAHQKAPGAPELGVDVAPRRDAVLDERADERVDAVALGARIVGPLGRLGDEARVIDEEAHVGEALRDDADVAALAVLVGLFPEREPLVHADHLHAERARLLDEARADVVGEEIALPARPEL